MAEIITHAFVSAKTQSPDTTIVSKNEWNDGHLLSGGSNGQVLLYDNTQDNNIRWGNKSIASHTTASVIVSTPTPLTNLATVTFTTELPLIIFLSYTVFGYTSVGNANGVIELYFDSVLYQSFGFLSPITQPTGATFPLTLAAGSHSGFLKLSTAGNVNVTAFTASIDILGVAT